MKTHALLQRTGITWRESDRLPSLVVIVSATVIAVHRGFFTMESIGRLIPIASQHDAVLWMFGTAFILMGALPALLVKTALGTPLRDYGVRLGDWKFGMKAVAVLLPIISLTMLLPAAYNPEMRAAFPLDHSAGDSIASFVLYQGIRLLVFYTAWEFFFRGFMLFGLRASVGDALAICIQVIPSCLWHIGMPLGELFSSIGGGVLFGMLALRTRSIVWPLLLHAGIGIVTDALIVGVGG